MGWIAGIALGFFLHEHEHLTLWWTIPLSVIVGLLVSLNIEYKR